MPAPVVRGIYYVKLAFDSGNACWHTGFGNYEFGGDTYLGVGTIASVSPIKEESGVKASGATVGLSGIKPEITALFLSEPYINRKAWIYFMPLDEGDQPVCATPKMLFFGKMDDISGNKGAASGFTVSIKSRFTDWERSRKSLYTDVEQQRLHPGDRGLEYVAQLSQKKIIWPRAAFLPDTRG
jgi:hypothetical protein